MKMVGMCASYRRPGNHKGSGTDPPEINNDNGLYGTVCVC